MMRRNWMWLLTVVAAGSIGTNVYVLRRPAPIAQAETERLPLLAAGTQLQEITGRNDRADLVRVPLAGTDRPTLLYFVKPTCIWCTRNRSNFAEIVKQRSDEYNIVFVSLNDSGFAAYVQRQRPDWGDARVTTLTGLSAKMKTDLLLGATPQTMIVDRSGKLLHNWIGAYTRSTLIAVENLFLVQMPGLVDEQAGRPTPQGR
jgi:peroxiredoxin